MSGTQESLECLVRPPAAAFSLNHDVSPLCGANERRSNEQQLREPGPHDDRPPAARQPREFPDFPRFDPHRLLRSGHLQTIVSAFLPAPRVPYRAELRYVELPGGEQLALHDDRPATWRAGDRCVLMLHGLSGSYRSPYMVRIAQKLNARGVRVFRMDMRGHGAGLRLAWSAGHAGRSEDVEAAIRTVVTLCPDSPLGLTGVSLGGNVLLKWLGEAGESAHPQVDRALAVSPPIDLMHCCQLIQRPKSRLYDRAFVRDLMKLVERRRPHWPELAQVDLRRAPRSLLEFDNRVTAPLSGFRDAEHYYTTASAGPKLATIAVPTLILTAADDPLVPAEIFAAAPRSEFVKLHVTQHGGHIGFIGRSGVDADRRWLDWRFVDWATHCWS